MDSLLLLLLLVLLLVVAGGSVYRADRALAGTYIGAVRPVSVRARNPIAFGYKARQIAVG